MTPEEVEKVYYEAYAKAFNDTETGVKPLDQHQVRMKGWQAVIDAIKSESDTEWAKRYLDTQPLNKQ